MISRGKVLEGGKRLNVFFEFHGGLVVEPNNVGYGPKLCPVRISAFVCVNVRRLSPAGEGFDMDVPFEVAE